MGDFIHRALIATHHDVDVLSHAKTIAINLGAFSIVTICHNGFFTFFMPPSGGKQGWSIEIYAETAREEVKTFLTSHHVHWIEIEYGDVQPRISSSYIQGVQNDLSALYRSDLDRHCGDDTGDQVVGALPEEGAMEEEE